MYAFGGHYPQPMKMVNDNANDDFDFLISGHKIVNLSREAISEVSVSDKMYFCC